MNIIENKIKELEDLYSSVLQELTQITEENFESRFPEAKSLAVAANSAKNDLFSAISPDMLKMYQNDLLGLTKQIQTTYDNIVQERQKQLASIALEIKNMQNQKKIAAYKR